MALVHREKNGLCWRQAESLAVPHAFTTRPGGVSTGSLASLNLGESRGDAPGNVAENWRRLCAAAGFPPERLVFSRQVHKTEVRTVTSADVHRIGERVPYEADGLVTDEPGLALCVFAADCVPILLWDPVRSVIAALHAGWRGTAANMAQAGVRAMAERFGCDPANLRGAVGPSIGGCCYETGPEVPEAMRRLPADVSDCLALREGRRYVDLRGINRRLLTAAGIPPENLDCSDECTMCSHDLFWSHRYTRGDRGVQAAVIMLPA